MKLESARAGVYLFADFILMYVIQDLSSVVCCYKIDSLLYSPYFPFSSMGSVNSMFLFYFEAFSIVA